MKNMDRQRLNRARIKREKRRIKKVHQEELPRQRRDERQEERDKAEAVVTRGQIVADAVKVRRQKQAYERGKL